MVSRVLNTGLGVALAVGLGLYLWVNAQVKPVGPGEARVIHIPTGAGTGEILTRLEGQGLIRNAFACRVGLERWHLAGRLQAGYYELSPTMSAREITERIASGKQATVKVTFPEGFTVKQIAERVAEKGLMQADAFLAEATPATVVGSGFEVKGDSLEGYLFPATYVFEYGSTPEDVIWQMAEGFRARVAVGMADDLRRSKRSLADIVTIASLIEREARIGKDRPLISGVIHNRLRKGMRLQVDATVLYALGEHKGRVTYEDLKVDSPFNTYRHKGLPPHPICNPGEASIRAALRPAKTEYLFYVARPDGSHVFTRTYAEHQQAIRAIRGG